MIMTDHTAAVWEEASGKELQQVSLAYKPRAYHTIFGIVWSLTELDLDGGWGPVRFAVSVFIFG